MSRKATVSSPRRPAPRRTLPHVMRRAARSAASQDTPEALLAHWTAMQQAMAATCDLRR